MAVAVGAAIVSKPLWLVCVLGVVAAVGFYTMLAPLLHWWPWSHDGQKRAAEANAGDSLAAWLGLRVEELRGLLARLEEVLATVPFDPSKAEAVQDHFYGIVDDVDRKLNTSALEWADYFDENPARYPVNLRFPRADHYRKQLVPAIESTIGQITHIQARLRQPPVATNLAGQPT